jgi:hypothetical protein
MDPETTLDEQRIENLAREILLPIRTNYLAGPESRDRVFEALNALAFAAATILAGAEDSEAQEFFAKALSKNLESILEDPFRELLKVLSDEDLIRFRRRLENVGNKRLAEILSHEINDRAPAL